MSLNVEQMTEFTIAVPGAGARIPYERSSMPAPSSRTFDSPVGLIR
jgi:hypothetical protein